MHENEIGVRGERFKKGWKRETSMNVGNEMSRDNS
jgi:hypothetical protein